MGLGGDLGDEWILNIWCWSWSCCFLFVIIIIIIFIYWGCEIGIGFCSSLVVGGGGGGGWEIDVVCDVWWGEGVVIYVLGVVEELLCGKGVFFFFGWGEFGWGDCDEFFVYFLEGVDGLFCLGIEGFGFLF